MDGAGYGAFGMPPTDPHFGDFRLKVLLTAASFKSTYGGPAVSVSRLAEALAGSGLRVGLWAADGSALHAPVSSGMKGIRLLAGPLASAMISYGLAEIIHDNGIWRSHNHHVARLAAKHRIARLVSPRGMLEPWALNHKWLKKRLAWAAYQRADLKRATCVHATADLEADHIRQMGLGVPVRIIPNGVDPAPSNVFHGLSMATSNQPKTALFLSRIHPKKGLLLLVEAWKREQPNGWRLRIVGPDEAGHRDEVERAVSLAQLQDVIYFSGPVEGEAKADVFANADLLVLPSYSENFGMVIAEALAHGLPVLTTTATPWSALATRGCGWCVSPTVEGISEGLRQATSLQRDALRRMGARGREWVVSDFGWNAVAKQFIDVYEQMLIVH